MKNKLFILLILSVLSFVVNAQNKKTTSTNKPASKTTISTSSGVSYKLGYIYEDYILDKYVAVKALQAKIAAKQEAGQKKYNDMAIVYQTQYLDYQNSVKNLDSMTTEKLNAKLKAVQNSRKEAEDFQRNMEKEIQEMTGDGIQVIKLAMDKVIKEVAAEKKYSLVLTRNKNSKLLTPGHVVLYSADGGRDNLSDAVIAKLNATK
jgi:outer membrane protein